MDPFNSRDNPAPLGSIVTLYTTGAGQMQPPVPDGKIAVDIRPKPVLPVSVLFNYTNRGTILYAGPAPGMIAGVLQINVRVLDVQCIEPNCFPDFSAIPVVIAIGPPDPNNWNSFGKYTSSGFVTIAVRR